MPSDDFRFLSGHFRVSHRRLALRLVGSDEWATFETELWGYPVLGGAAFIDEMHGTLAGREFWGMTLRLHDPILDQWNLYWTDTWNPELCPPLTGSLGRQGGKFYGLQDEGGVPVLARFTWSEISETGAYWEQAFSTDDGASWETNWTMRFERLLDTLRPIPPRAY